MKIRSDVCLRYESFVRVHKNNTLKNETNESEWRVVRGYEGGEVGSVGGSICFE